MERSRLDEITLIYWPTAYREDAYALLAGFQLVELGDDRLGVGLQIVLAPSQQR